jgi:hypothetical protein
LTSRVAEFYLLIPKQLMNFSTRGCRDNERRL